MSRRRYADDVVHENRFTGCVLIEMAARIAIRYRGKAPAVSDLRKDFGISRAQAYRWRRAFLNAGSPA